MAITLLILFVILITIIINDYYRNNFTQVAVGQVDGYQILSFP